MLSNTTQKLLLSNPIFNEHLMKYSQYYVVLQVAAELVLKFSKLRFSNP